MTEVLMWGINKIISNGLCEYRHPDVGKHRCFHSEGDMDCAYKTCPLKVAEELWSDE